jgi:PAS domain S-box-containing protein
MAKKIESADHALIAGGKQLVVAEEQLHTRHGVKFLHSIKLPIKGKNRKINYVFSMCTDVTKQKIMEKRIEESERFLNNVVENIPDIVYVTDAKDFRIKLMNSAGEQLFGVNEKEIIGKTVSALFSKEIAELLEKKDAELMFKKSIVDVPELEFRGKNHPLILKLRKLPIFDNKGELTYILTIAENITHTKELEMVKSQFISSVSHELRSPITPIKAQVQRLIERDFDPKEKQAALESILRNTNRLDRLIQDILEINRIESGKLKIMKKEENLNNVISFAISDAEPVAKHRGTEIFYKQEKLPSVKLDRDRILEVLINLIDNATKYGKKKVWVSAKQSGKEIVVSVKDNGIGITKKELNSVFTPFYRAQRPEVLKYEGTGLGLSISKSIIELHGGRIWVESKLRKGSTFYFSLPLNGESHS